MTTLAFAAAHSAERSVAIAGLGLRVFHYVAEGFAGPARPILGLSVRLLERRPRPASFHEDSGLHGFLDLPPGPVLVHVQDPLGRYAERSARYLVPDRSLQRRALEQGLDPGPSGIAGVLHDLPLRPGVGYAIRSGQTSIWGRVRSAAGAPQPFARLQVATRLVDGTPTRLITHADARGDYRIVFQGERAAFSAPVPPSNGNPGTPGSIVTRFDRRLEVHVLRNAPDPRRPAVAAFPSDFDGLDPDAPGGPYRRVAAELEEPASGTRVTGAPLLAPLEVGRNARWDVVTP